MLAPLLLGGASASAASTSGSSSSPPPPRQVSAGATVAPNPSDVVASATWGVQNGKPFFHVTKGKLVGRYTLANAQSNVVAAQAVTPDVTASCTEYISDLTIDAEVFHWTASQTCYGEFGAQDYKTQLWRSSWSGPRGYTSWAYDPSSGLSFQSYISAEWGTPCDTSGGYYDYYPVMQGYASNIGSGPTIRSENQLDLYCGTTAPY